MTLALVVAAAGGFGALLRYVADGAVQARLAGPFPWGTTAVNVSGSLILGLLTGLAWYHGLGSSTSSVLGTGFCGGLTTWSTASFETLRLLQTGRRRLAAGYLLGGLVVGCAAGVAGIALAAL
jgi:CrcB protein